MIIGLDTSVVLRLLTGQPEAQAVAARSRLQQAQADGDRIIVDATVLAEAYHALVHHYQVSKSEAREYLFRMVNSGVINAEPVSLIEALRPADGAGLVDRLILYRYRSLDATTWTFDRALGAAGATLVK